MTPPNDDPIVDHATQLYIDLRDSIGAHLLNYSHEDEDQIGIIIATAMMGLGSHCFTSLIAMTVGDENKRKMTTAILKHLDALRSDITAELPSRPTNTTVH